MYADESNAHGYSYSAPLEESSSADVLWGTTAPYIDPADLADTSYTINDSQSWGQVMAGPRLTQAMTTAHTMTANMASDWGGGAVTTVRRPRVDPEEVGAKRVNSGTKRVGSKPQTQAESSKDITAKLQTQADLLAKAKELEQELSHYRYR
jgi:hypothetical protein